jgi:TP901 family phage tail tape measure protein
MNIGHLTATIGADVRPLSRAQRSVNSFTKNVTGRFKSMNKAVLGLQGAIAGLSVAFVMKKVISAAADYESAVVDMGKVTDQTFEDIRKQVESLDPALGNSTELVQAYYQTISAGVTEPVKALELVTVASKAAKAAHTGQGEVIKVLTKLMAGFGGQIKDVATASDLMFAIEKEGQTTFQELVPVMGELGNMARLTNIHYTELAASLALVTQTAASTAEATTQVKAVMTALLKPTDQMKSAFSEFSTVASAVQELGLVPFLRKVWEESGRTAEGLADLLGGRKEALIGFAGLMANNFENLADKLVNIKAQVGATNRAWEQYQTTTKGIVDLVKNIFMNQLIQIGTAALPAIKNVLEDVAEKMQDWYEANQDFIAQDLERHINKVKDGLGSLVGIFNALPEGIVGAAGVGIVARVISGSTPIGRLVFMLTLLNEQLKVLNLDLGSIMRTSRELMAEGGSISNLIQVFTGERHWNTGELIADMKTIKEQAKQVEFEGFGGDVALNIAPGAFEEADAALVRIQDLNDAIELALAQTVESTVAGNAAIVESEKATAAERKAVLEDWNSFSHTIGLSTTQVDLLELQSRYDGFKKFVDDEVALEQWLQDEKKMILVRASNEQLALYEELYKTTGHQEYAEKAIEAYGRVVAAQEESWARILGSEDEANILRIAREEEYANRVFGFVDSIVDAESSGAQRRLQITNDMVSSKIAAEQRAADAAVDNVERVTSAHKTGMTIRGRIEGDITYGLGAANPAGIIGAARSKGKKMQIATGFQEGIESVPSTGFYQLHQGEKVIPADQNRPGGGNDYTINIVVQGNMEQQDIGELARSVRTEIEKLEARGA